MGFMKKPKIDPPKLGPLPPTSASADPTGGSMGTRRSFSMAGVSSGSLVNPNLLRRNRNGDRPIRTQTGGSS